MNDKLYLVTRDELEEFVTSNESSSEIPEEDLTTLPPILENRFNELENHIALLENRISRTEILIESSIEELSKI